MTNCYIMSVENEVTNISEYFESNYLKWQLENGRKSLDEFAKYLGLSRGYISQLLNGDKQRVGRGTAYIICEKLNDYSLLDILGYPYPKKTEISYDELPEQLGQSLSKAMSEANKLIGEGLDPTSEEGERIIIRIFEKQGFTYESPRKKKS